MDSWEYFITQGVLCTALCSTYVVLAGGEVGGLGPVGGVVVPAAVEREVHGDGDDAGLVPADALLPHPDGVAPPLEVEEGVLLPAPVDVLSLLPHNLRPEPEQISLKVKPKCPSVSLTNDLLYTFKTLL